MKRYTEEFRKEALHLILEENRSIASVARELGVSQASLHQWKKQHLEELATPDGEMTPKEMMQRIRELEKQLKNAQQDKAILKKAMRFFASE